MVKQKRRAIITLFLLSISAALLAADYRIDEPFVPACPEVLAQGSSFTANARGFPALFTNPAAFASKEGSTTLYSSSAWLYANPTRALLAVTDPDSAALVNFVEEEITGGGFGFGSADGIGYVGNGIGISALINIDAYLWGSTLPAAAGILCITMAYIAGYAVPLEISRTTIMLGADIRPMIRIRAPIDHQVMLDFLGALQSGGNPLANLNSADALHGYAIGLDAGGILERGGFRLGFSMRNILGSRFKYTQDPFGDIIASLRDSGGFPVGGTPVNDYRIPLDFNVGAAYRLRFRKTRLLNSLSLHLSVNDVISTIRERRPPLELLHLGTEIELFRFLKLWAGLNDSYPTFGFGVQLWVLDLNAAVFTREVGTNLWDRPSPGIVMEAAIRID